MNPLDRLFAVIRSSSFCYRFTLFARVLLAAGFIPTGMIKLLGHRFTQISVENPIGAFFEAMFQTGIYWNFLGLSQVLAGCLLLIPVVAHLGAILFLPIMVNIFIITVSVGFKGTPVVTGSMLLAVIYLCIWDFHRFRPMLTTRPLHLDVRSHRLDVWEKVSFAVWGFSLIAFFSALRSAQLFNGKLALAAVFLGVIAGLAALLRFFWLWRQNRLSCD